MINSLMYGKDISIGEIINCLILKIGNKHAESMKNCLKK